MNLHARSWFHVFLVKETDNDKIKSLYVSGVAYFQDTT